MTPYRALGALLVAALLLAASAAHATCREDVVQLRGDWGEARFTVEIADTEESRAQGLMHRTDLPMGAGMLFIYDEPGRASFWMRNTLIPLDMLFADRHGRITRIHHEAQPHDETPIDGGSDVLMVLEINGGLAARLGITEGSALRHPRLEDDLAAWPCAPR